MNEVEKKLQEFKIWYDAELPYHDDSIGFFCKLISTIPKVEMVKGRTKRYEECIGKFTRKYLPFIDPQENNFMVSDYLTDLVGIRAVCFYAEEVYDIRRGLRRYFKELEISDKSSQLEKTDDKFGYKSLHLQLVLKRGLKGIDDAEKFRDLQFELQIRTVIQDAWSILDHKIKYKKSIPQNIKRRVNRLSALFEIADEEFSNIQRVISKEELKINARLKKGGQIETRKILDVFRFLFIALKYFPDYDFVEHKVDGFVQEILMLKSDFTEGAFNEALQGNLPYVNTLEKSINQQLNPYTKIRYCLYKSDAERFKSMLSGHQQGVFDDLR
ncbi:(p)ppGpp synthetase [Echinicola soli]|uniref:(P)ppGpp synthetase n=1 Tax=Echinicola soli TaxID=2591634 RepID=A0A514CMN0_9BACT|nr:(p)ppGpp synthetase [Echinicola soli]QDH81082.1 (p)ppGpp synthetase [Echinicola soli]